MTHAVSFGIEELFFSTTDPKGIIRSSNDVFLRVSGFTAAEMYGKPHNVVRHADMPRAVFRTFWEFLGAGRPIAAYVKNRASDGGYYWVMATAAPLSTGFVSVRLKPSTPIFETAKEIYAAVLRTEREVENGDVRRRKAAIDAGVEKLDELLAERGFASYEAFMTAALPAEVRAREDALGDGARDALRTIPASASPPLAGILRSCSAVNRYLDGLLEDLRTYEETSRQLAGKSRFILGLAGDIRLFSLNAMLASARLGTEGAPLGVVAETMRATSDSAGPVIHDLNREIDNAVDLLAEMGSRIAAGKVQVEMVMRFVHELLRGGDDVDVDGFASEVATLAECLDGGVSALMGCQQRLHEALARMLRNVASVNGDLNVIRTLETNGRIEAARGADSESVQGLFTAIGEQVIAARNEMAGFDSVRDLADARDLEAEQGVQRHVLTIGQHVDGMLREAA